MKIINTLYFCSVIFLFTQASENPLKYLDTKEILNNLTREEVRGLTDLTQAVFFEDFKPIIMQLCSSVKEDRINTILQEWLSKQNRLYVSQNENDNENIEILLSRDQFLKKIRGVCVVVKNQIQQELWIKFLAVEKNQRRKGIGSELLVTALNRYKNMKKCQLVTFAQGNEPVHKFYEKHGFQKGSLVTVDERFPNTHVLYSLDLEK